jgi:cytochrome c biogenesis protein CcdA/thiol-disulfide isomerase/thioredoxin
VIIAVLAFIGGALTVLSPCTLPVLPFVFARADRPFARSTLPLLLGLALTFAAVATLAAVGGGWAVRLNRDARVLALVVLGTFGVALLSSRVADWLARPALALGNRLLERQQADAAAETSQSLLIGVATGLLWAPCAGPILGLILTGAAISGPALGTSLLLLAYAAGAALSLGLAVFAGRRVYGAMRRWLGVASALRRVAGVAILIAVGAIALGWDTGVLTRWSTAGTQRFEQRLVGSLPTAPGVNPARRPPVAAALAALQGATSWINSGPLSVQSLRGKVVLVDFWTYSCINCLRTLPYLENWYQRYRDDGLVIVGVHTPEFAFEKDPDNVRRAVAELGIRYPVAIDSAYAVWKAFGNGFWPEHYLIDATGKLREQHVGEGGYRDTEQQIRALLQEAGHGALPPISSDRAASGAMAQSDAADLASPETYLGYARAERFSSSHALVHDEVSDYPAPSQLARNQWSLQGRWRVGSESARLEAADGSVVFRFHARDVHLVLSPGPGQPAVRFQVTIDGREPGADRGSDVDVHGNGVVHEQRLYQLIRQDGPISDHVFRIGFLDPGVTAYAFTFG